MQVAAAGSAHMQMVLQLCQPVWARAGRRSQQHSLAARKEWGRWLPAHGTCEQLQEAVRCVAHVWCLCYAGWYCTAHAAPLRCAEQGAD